MGQLYSKLNQLVMNDVETAADPDRPREKLETAFNTPARPFQIRLPDPRSATQFINRTPILAATADTVSSGDTPKAPKSVARPRYLGTDLDDVLPNSAGELQTSVVQRSGVSTMATSTPVHRIQRKAISPVTAAQEIIDSVIDQAVGQVSEMRFSDTGVCGVVTSERSVSLPSSGATVSTANQALIMSSISTDSGRISFAEEARASESREPSYAEEVVIQPGDVQGISCVDDVVGVILEEGSESLVANWSGIGGSDRSVGIDVEDSAQNFMGDCSQPEVSIIVQDLDLDQQTDILIAQDSQVNQQTDIIIAQDCQADQQCDSIAQDSLSFSNQQSDSMVVHNDSASFANHSGDFEWDNDNDSILVSSPAVKPDTGINNMENLITPKKNILMRKSGGRTPLGDVSTNSPIIQKNLTPKQQTKSFTAIDHKIWKNVQDERLKRGLDAENTPPHAAFNSYPLEVVQSAPGKMRTKTNKNTTKWSNDSLLI